ncbi:MAG: hypothetical protein FWH02_02980, partial [Oscillospiraceae bacterium]|nr:hypothetical protein [Oscillospiraceae bacterium]
IPFFAFKPWSLARLSDWADYRAKHMTCAMKGTKLCGLSERGFGVSPARFGYFAALQSNYPRGMSG